MANFLENLGLDLFNESDDMFMKFALNSAKEGHIVKTYTGNPYIDAHYGDVDVVVRLEKSSENGNYNITGLDTHTAGSCVWDFRVISDITPKDKSIAEKQLLVSRADDNSGLLVINVLNADVLPSYMEDDIIKLQVVAFPVSIDYFENEEAYEESQPDERNGRKMFLASGSIMPTGFLNNHDPKKPEEEKDYSMDELMLLQGKVEGAYLGNFKLGGEKYPSYIQCRVNTLYGPLDIIHTEDQIKEEQRKYIKPGATVSCVIVMSGDAAIYDYEDGIVKDEEHHLRLLRTVFTKGHAERANAILAENASYVSDVSKQNITGKQNIIERIRYVHDKADVKYFAHMATITECDRDDMKYGIGKRCIVLAADDEHAYESIVFIEMDDYDNICSIYVCNDSAYHFKIDEKKVYKNELSDVQLPDSIYEPIIKRARFLNFIDNTITDEEIVQGIDTYRSYRFNAEEMIEHVNGVVFEDENSMENVFGYLFAKAIEANLPDYDHISYYPEDAKRGILNIEADEKYRTMLEDMFQDGKLFYNDFNFLLETNMITNENVANDLFNILVVVQKIGELYAKHKFRSTELLSGDQGEK